MWVLTQPQQHQHAGLRCHLAMWSLHGPQPSATPLGQKLTMLGKERVGFLHVAMKWWLIIQLELWKTCWVVSWLFSLALASWASKDMVKVEEKDGERNLAINFYGIVTAAVAPFSVHKNGQRKTSLVWFAKKLQSHCSYLPLQHVSIDFRKDPLLLSSLFSFLHVLSFFAISIFPFLTGQKNYAYVRMYGVGAAWSLRSLPT